MAPRPSASLTMRRVRSATSCLSSCRRRALTSMRYLPKSAAERQQMLREIGAGSIDDLFAPIPGEYRLRRELRVPGALAESEIMDYFRQRAAENAAGFAMFLGAGAYSHY